LSQIKNKKNMKKHKLEIPELQTAKWATTNIENQLHISTGERQIKMCNSDGTGEPLVSSNEFGADIIRFAANEGVGNHTHEGDHILLVLSGKGIVEYNGVEYGLFPGLCYLIPGAVDHAIKAETDLVLIAVGNNHRPLDSIERMTPVK